VDCRLRLQNKITLIGVAILDLAFVDPTIWRFIDNPSGVSRCRSRTRHKGDKKPRLANLKMAGYSAFAPELPEDEWLSKGEVSF
jgi:hypothetical protein